MPVPMATHAPKLMTRNLKLVIRRLPPGLSQEEFETSLGEEWKVGGGRVDWAVYKPGKISKDLSKPSKPSRAYLNVTKHDYVGVLSDTIRNTRFHDAKASFKDPVLLGPPSVEYATYPKTPQTKVRKDNRQGTIDQDPEFIEFLESLTNPAPKAAIVDQRDGKPKEKVTTTPLIQYLKDKKANKGKEAAAAAAAATTSKAAKHARHLSKDTQSTTSSNSEKKPPAKAAPASADKRSAQAIMVEKAARDAARILSKQAATPSKPHTPSTVAASPVAPPTILANSPLAEKKRERGSASAAASILRRDLGIGATPGSRGGRRGLPAGQSRPTADGSPQAPTTTSVRGGDAKAMENSTSAPSTDPPSNGKTVVPPTAPANQPQAPSAPKPPTGPAATRGAAKSSAPSSAASSATPPSAPAKSNTVSATATQAFLKHANPSQGITEPLLEETFAAFGAVKRVEIDKKKGSAYVDFEEPEGLQKAIKASPIKVARGQVVVLERRIGPNLQGRSVRGGPMMNSRGIPDARGGGMLNHRGRGGLAMGPLGGRGGSMRGQPSPLLSLPQHLHLPPSSSNPFTNTSLSSPLSAPIRGDPEPQPLPERISCITKPRLRRITPQTCALTIEPLVNNPPASQVRKYYSAPLTRIGGSPCHIELRKSVGKGVIRISDEQIGYAAFDVLKACEAKGGAGWGQFEHSWGWYIFVYGDTV
ncbi:MAG: hypothetical protein L6R40_006492 [Gallowayella cf. fulva]|nr:MAG: hypothetical protein L6R40_006492 [Xanthomendoza cf. fulva]